MEDIAGGKKSANQNHPPSPGGAAADPGASDGKRRLRYSDLEMEQPVPKKFKEAEKNAAETSGPREEEQTEAAIEAKRAERDLLRQVRNRALAELLLLSAMEYALSEYLIPATENDNNV